MPAADIIQLQPATNKLVIINLPLTGGWIGGVHFSLVSWPNTATIHEFHFISDQRGPTLPPLYRTITPWTMAVNYRYGWFLQRYEAMAKIRYTSTNEISCCIETNRNAVPLDVI